MITIALPRLVAGRDLADALVTAAGSLDGNIVVVDCSRTTDGSRSFASQLVRRILLEGGARQMRVVDAPAEFAEYVAHSAATQSVATKLELVSDSKRVLA